MTKLPSSLSYLPGTGLFGGFVSGYNVVFHSGIGDMKIFYDPQISTPQLSQQNLYEIFRLINKYVQYLEM